MRIKNVLKKFCKQKEQQDELIRLFKIYESTDDGYWATEIEIQILNYLRNKYKAELEKENNLKCEKYKKTINNEIESNKRVIKEQISEESIKRAEIRIDLCKKLLLEIENEQN